MMKLCEQNHNVIAFTCAECPLCKSVKALETREKEHAVTEKKIWDLEGTVADLEYQIDKLKEQ